jgi:hypothetical protein
MNGLEERLRSELARSTSWVLPAPDPMDRLLRRRRRRQWRRRVGVAMVAAVAVALTGGTLATVGSPRPSPAPAPTNNARLPDVPGTTITPLIRQLIESPTRGNLAGNAALVADLTEKLRGNRSHWLVAAALTRVKVLLLADVEIARVYSVAYYDDDRAVFVDGSGFTDTSVADLAGGEYGGSTGPATPFPVGNSGVEPTGKPSYSYQTALAPAGCTIATASSFRLSAGQAVALWTDVGADYLVREGNQDLPWWRFSCGGTVQKVQRGNLQGSPPKQAPTVTERGRADPAAVQDAFHNWQTLPGVSITKYRALWGGTPPGGTRSVVVVAGATDGGVEVCAVTTGTGAGTALSSTVAGRSPDDGSDSTMAGVGGVSTGVAASTDLVVVRLPDDQHPSLLSDRLLILAPPGTIEATVTGSVTRTVPLKDGVGVVTAPAPADIQVHAGGATARVAEPSGAAALVFGLPFTAS